MAKSGFGALADAVKTSIGEFEKASDNMVTAYMNGAAGVTFGIEPLIAYMHRKQLEIQTVRIILSAKLNNLGEERIRARIRQSA